MNTGKTAIMIRGAGLDLLQRSGKMCRLPHWYRQQYGCMLWVHKKCKGLKCLYRDLIYRRSICQGTALSIEEDHARRFRLYMTN